MGKKVLCLFLIVGFVVSVGLTGCARSTKELSDAEAALQEAQAAGAQELAPAEYEAAESLIQRAKELMAAGKHREARDLLVEARYKAIEAKGKAVIKQQESQRSAVEELERERELEAAKAEGMEEAPQLRDIFFDFDSYAIRADARPVLADNAEVLKKMVFDGLVVIEGYCDIRGTEEYNLALGQRRADTTRAYLVGLGVDPAMLEAVSRGETEKFARGTTEEAYQQNRRAHFVTPR